MDQKAELKRAYKENPPPPGIYKITNKANGKVLVSKGMDVQGKMNGQRAQLRMGAHRNVELQEDWKRFGADQFIFEVIDYLTPSITLCRLRARTWKPSNGSGLPSLSPMERGAITKRRRTKRAGSPLKSPDVFGTKLMRPARIRFRIRRDGSLEG